MSPQFSSTIRLATQSEFVSFDMSGMRKRGIYTGDPFTIHDRVKLKDEGITDGAYDCTVGGITNGSHVTLFHLIPGSSEREAEEELIEDIAQLKQEHPDLRALITGGLCDDGPSARIRRMLMDLFDRFGIPVTMIWGQQTGGSTDLHYSTQTDTWTLHTAKPWSQNRQDDAKTVPDLRCSYEQIDLDPSDHLIVQGEEIPGSRINQLG